MEAVIAISAFNERNDVDEISLGGDGYFCLRLSFASIEI